MLEITWDIFFVVLSYNCLVVKFLSNGKFLFQLAEAAKELSGGGAD